MTASTLARAARAQAEARPLHRCPDPECNAPLDVPGGMTFSVMPGAPVVVRVTVWCQECGKSCLAVYRRRGEKVEVRVERAT